MIPKTVRQAEKLSQSRDDLRKRVAALKADNERLRKELAILEAQYQRLEATAERFADIITRQAVTPEQPPSGSKP